MKNATWTTCSTSFECFHYFRQFFGLFVFCFFRETQRNIAFTVSAICPILGTPYFFIMRKIRNKIYDCRGPNGQRMYDTSRIIFASQCRAVICCFGSRISLSLKCVCDGAHWPQCEVTAFNNNHFSVDEETGEKKNEQSCTRPIRLQARLAGFGALPCLAPFGWCALRYMRICICVVFDWTIN